MNSVKRYYIAMERSLDKNFRSALSLSCDSNFVVKWKLIILLVGLVTP